MTQRGKSSETSVERLRRECDEEGIVLTGEFRTDEYLQEVIDGAHHWIAGRRWGWTTVAKNFLRDGRYHAGLR